jgi:hypothetical protein
LRCGCSKESNGRSEHNERFAHRVDLSSEIELLNVQ